MNNYTEFDVANIIGQLLQIISIQNNRNIQVRNLKATNLRFDNHDPTGTMKFTNIETSVEQKEDTYRFNSMLCNLQFKAPEVLNGVSDDDKRSDMWSVGVLMYLLLIGNLPFDGNNDFEI